ncbi:hypothetical protein CHUAL_004418 [Chamberlinius hualienensis]
MASEIVKTSNNVDYSSNSTTTTLITLFPTNNSSIKPINHSSITFTQIIIPIATVLFAIILAILLVIMLRKSRFCLTSNVTNAIDYKYVQHAVNVLADAQAA